MMARELLPGFVVELEKLSLDGRAIQRGVGAGAGIGGLVGAGVGGVRGGMARFREARQQGAGVGQAGAAALAGGLRGAATGALKGTAVGAGLGGAAGALRPERAIRAADTLAGADTLVGKASRFGERQLHGFVGGSPHDLERVRGGAYEARQNLAGALQKGSGRQVEKARAWADAADKSQQMGLTSLPGIAQAVKQHGVGKVVQTGATEQWRSMGPGMKAMMVGMPAMSLANTALSPEGAGPGKGERAGRALGALGGGLAPLPLGAGIALGAGLEQAGGLVGRGVDRLRGRGAVQPPTAPPEGAQLATV
jgi:hypothetical protein